MYIQFKINVRVNTDVKNWHQCYIHLWFCINPALQNNCTTQSEGMVTVWLCGKSSFLSANEKILIFYAFLHIRWKTKRKHTFFSLPFFVATHQAFCNSETGNIWKILRLFITNGEYLSFNIRLMKQAITEIWNKIFH